MGELTRSLWVVEERSDRDPARDRVNAAITIRGRITDLAGQAAPNLRVMSAALSDSVFTDEDGEFEIQAAKTVVMPKHSNRIIS